MRRTAGALLILVVTSCIWFSCAKEPEEGVLARVGGAAITEAQIEERMVGMPAYMRRQFETPEGKKRLLEGLIEEELYYRDAVALGLDKRQDFKAEIELAQRNVLIRHYFDKVIEVRSAVADSEIVNYYNENPNDFLVGEGDSIRPFAEVRQDITSRLSYLKRRRVHNEILTELKSKYGVSVVADSVLLSGDIGPDVELAVVAGKAIKPGDLDEKMSSMPPYMSEQFKTPQGRKRLLDGMVEEQIFYKEARATGLHNQQDYKQEIERTRRNILVRSYFDKMLQDRSEPTEEEIAQYYEDHKHEFTFSDYARVRHILVPTEEDAYKVRRELDGGADFAELAAQHSLDGMSRKDGGLIGHAILPQRPIEGLGQVPEFTQACFSMEAGDISVPVKTAKGYHIILVEERGKDYLLPFEDAREDITQRVSKEKRGTVKGTLLAELKTKYEVVYVSDVGKLSPEDLFRVASESSNPREKIRYYEQFLQEYPDNERAYEAKFMIGFTYAEDLKNHAEAQKVFEEFLLQYQDSDLADDAKWMLENMESGEHPVFESEGS